MTDEAKTEMTKDARKDLSDALRDAVLNTESTEVVAEAVHVILADIDSNLQVSIENARLRQRVEDLESDLTSMRKDLKTQKMHRTKAENKVKKLEGKKSKKSDDEEKDASDDEPEVDSFFDEPDSSSMEVVKGIIGQERDDSGWTSIQVVRDEASLLDIESDDVDAIIDYWTNSDDVNIEKDGMKVRIVEEK